VGTSGERERGNERVSGSGWFLKAVADDARITGVRDKKPRRHALSRAMPWM
jgi:hypothetical protein